MTGAADAEARYRAMLWRLEAYFASRTDVKNWKKTVPERRMFLVCPVSALENPEFLSYDQPGRGALCPCLWRRFI